MDNVSVIKKSYLIVLMCLIKHSMLIIASILSFSHKWLEFLII